MNGHTDKFTAVLLIEARGGGGVDFGHTARMFFEPPSQGTFSSASGVLFSTATPIPEPQSVALMRVGLGLVASGVRRKLEAG